MQDYNFIFFKRTQKTREDGARGKDGIDHCVTAIVLYPRPPICIIESLLENVMKKKEKQTKFSGGSV
jgi:hypothetical protein